MGALDGVRVIELAGIGPGPFCGMMLADQGAEVIQVDRAAAVRGGDPARPPGNVNGRGRRSIGVDLKSPEGVETVLRLVEGAGMVFEGFRPGVAERLGVGPDDCLARNPAIVYGRMTGWGQDGPYSSMAGHDINYIALAGVLAHIGRSDSGPVPPMNLVGDFGGGGMYLAYGMVCALLEARNSGKGQVVDAAMVDGAASLMSFIHGMLASGFHSPERGTNLLDTGAHFYDVYECADGGWISLGSIEPQFYAELLDKLGLDAERFGKQNDRDLWPELSAEIAAVVRMKTRDEWDAILEGSDVCYAPVLTVDEAIRHPHNVARGTFIDVGGITQPGPAPRLSRTPGEVRRPPAHAGQHTDEVLSEAGFDDDEVAALRASGAVA
ncbi:MAG TPA: carnitine dehydratase [Acidimicrobiaceae bacterium]|jgi:alpha-methylacyl-CoA racemase|uniref:Carnitine dehydratase n=1 Tax=marine metagenome TaxID=408172 RepID=A0A381T6I1_9ZZZZ|nr:CaiB/BaiF CoA-transferase family protein [Actinomycetota bacterium]MED5584441.1 CaiB/BaiF CoA-transferase family protein [Actinomycetota bacterium]MEE3115518.1 CaiB/BaiF CoA-transferase family protein [Actinomycetota bacterium]MEE3275303.1 CaiB/BaiF CoA-transferase family protein [Actinomycetota bacterium]HBM56054.1 carnitine dehydratase [Acidimicrobiaceae bacterium]|tara:strand:- start:3430 stop:4572 length:1143 start_codon:yes stop_codon:yes gene_type:complete